MLAESIEGTDGQRLACAVSYGYNSGIERRDLHCAVMGQSRLILGLRVQNRPP